MKNRYLSSIQEQYTPLSREEEKLLVLKYRNEPEELRNLLVLHNVGLIYKYSKHWRKFYDADDLASIGIKGLYDAAKAFKLDSGVRFSTFAQFGIRTAFAREAKNWKTVIDERSESFSAKLYDEGGQKYLDWLEAKAVEKKNCDGELQDTYDIVADMIDRPADALRLVLESYCDNIPDRSKEIFLKWHSMQASISDIARIYQMSRQRANEIINSVATCICTTVRGLIIKHPSVVSSQPQWHAGSSDVEYCNAWEKWNKIVDMKCRDMLKLPTHI